MIFTINKEVLFQNQKIPYELKNLIVQIIKKIVHHTDLEANSYNNLKNYRRLETNMHSGLFIELQRVKQMQINGLKKYYPFIGRSNSKPYYFIS